MKHRPRVNSLPAIPLTGLIQPALSEYDALSSIGNDPVPLGQKPILLEE